jgi:hypothetical protein
MAISNEQLLDFVRRNPIGVACGVISLALFGAYYFRSGLTDEANTTLRTKQDESDRYANNIKNSGGPGSEELKAEYDSLAAANKQIEARLIRTQFGVNYGYFEQIAADTGAKRLSPVSQAAPSAAAKAVPKGGFVPVAFTFVVQGTYAQILDVLDRLENGQHFCRVNTASIGKAAAAGSDLLTLSLNLELLGLQQ